MRLIIGLLTVAFFMPAIAEQQASAIDQGKAVYDYYCYQCHAYSGNAKTLAGQYLEIKPRDFTRASYEELTRERMINSVTHGRPGTGMVNFDKTLSQTEIHNVVDYIRAKLMSLENKDARYHTEENGWENHDRYRLAYPFVSGELTLSMPWDSLTEDQRRGRRLFAGACISCHESHENNEDGIVWELSAASYPREHYSHKLGYVDALSGASVHADHEKPVSEEGLSEQALQGRQLFLDNCAFCHAPDGSSRNWIGSFLEPRPRDFTQRDFSQKMSHDFLQQVIMNGVNGTSMPAWKSVLEAEQIEDLITFMLEAFGDQVEVNR